MTTRTFVLMIGALFMATVAACSPSTSRAEMNAIMSDVNQVAVTVRPMVVGDLDEITIADIGWAACGEIDGPVNYGHRVGGPSDSLPDLDEFRAWATDNDYVDTTRAGDDDYERWDNQDAGVHIAVDLAPDSRTMSVTQFDCVQPYDDFDLDHSAMASNITDLVERDAPADEYPMLVEQNP